MWQPLALPFDNSIEFMEIGKILYICCFQHINKKHCFDYNLHSVTVDGLHIITVHWPSTRSPWAVSLSTQKAQRKWRKLLSANLYEDILGVVINLENHSAWVLAPNPMDRHASTDLDQTSAWSCMSCMMLSLWVSTTYIFLLIQLLMTEHFGIFFSIICSHLWSVITWMSPLTFYKIIHLHFILRERERERQHGAHAHTQKNNNKVEKNGSTWEREMKRERQGRQ